MLCLRYLVCFSSLPLKIDALEAGFLAWRCTEGSHSPKDPAKGQIRGWACRPSPPFPLLFMGTQLQPRPRDREAGATVKGFLERAS